MTRKRYTLIYCLLLWLLPLPVAATTATPVPRFSLLTCGPGQEIYSLFGHTALRMQLPEQGIDRVFNYGIFNFHTPHFVLRFALGETDYLLGATNYDHFLSQYAWEERWVDEQPLQLDSVAAQRLYHLLSENYRPENRLYRYNFFFDNCSTRPRDLVEKALEGSIHYADEMEEPQADLTFRTLIHRYSEHHPWSRLGMDLCLGSEADRPISRREATFVPLVLEEVFAQATICPAGQEPRPLTSDRQPLLTDAAPESADTLWTPLTCACLLLVLVAGATLWEWRQNRRLWGLDLLLLAAAGIAGSILAFLACLSSHPAVSPNWLLLVFHPFYLLALPWVIWSDIKRRKNLFMQVVFAELIFFILFWGLIPQVFPLSVLPLALCLLLRCGKHVFGQCPNRNH